MISGTLYCSVSFGRKRCDTLDNVVMIVRRTRTGGGQGTSCGAEDVWAIQKTAYQKKAFESPHRMSKL